MALCVQEKGHILSENLQYIPLDSLCLRIDMVLRYFLLVLC